MTPKEKEAEKKKDAEYHRTKTLLKSVLDAFENSIADFKNNANEFTRTG